MMLSSALDWLRATTPVEVKEYYWAARTIYLHPWFWLFTSSILVLEWLRPGVKTQRVLSRGLAQDFVWFNADMVMRVALLPAYVGMLGAIYRSTTGGFTVAALVPLPLWVKIVLAVVVFDFLQWVFHWIRHKVLPLWHFHSIHHSQRELNTFTDLRIHTVEYFITELMAFMPMLTLGVPALAVMGVGGARMWLARFTHANIGTNLGPLKHIIVSPQYHRIHHSIEPQHQDRNFGVLLTVWDRMFGTMNRNYDEYPATGVMGLDLDPPTGDSPLAWLRNFGRVWLHPFRAISSPDTRKGPTEPS